MSGFVFFTDLPVLLLVQTLLKSLDNFALVVALFFILCGNIMTAGSIVDRLIKFANALVSWLPGGLGMAGVLACGLFGAIANKDLIYVSKAVMPFVLIQIAVLLLMTYMPGMALWLPRAVGFLH